MDTNILEFYNDFTIMYVNNPDFASIVRKFVLKTSTERRSEERKSVSITVKDMYRDAFIGAVDLYVSIMKEKMSAENARRLGKVMMYVYDNDKDGKWFAPRSGKESFNVVNFCRMQYYLYNNGFYVDAMCCGKVMDLNDISHLIVGHENCDKDAVVHKELSIIAPNSLLQSTINIYIRKDTLCKSFEDFCANLIPANFSKKEDYI